MLSHLISSTLLLVFTLLLLDVSSVSASRNHLNVPRNRHQQLTNRLARAETVPSPEVKPLRKRRSCRAPTGAPKPPSLAVNSTSTSSTRAASTKATATPTKTPIKENPSGGGGGKGGVGKPANWPSQTQAGAAPTAIRAHPGDPLLKELSKAYDNSNNALFNAKHSGKMTYYGQGLGACGDTYDDQSFTAAVSRLMYDKWPGATAETNRNPICGPYVPGRKTLSQAGNFVTAIGGQSFVNIGGDGLLNCAPGVQCHIPLTATVTHGGKSIQVKIVDRCEGCAEGDIDLTPAGFAALADMGLGRTDVEWFFNKY